MGEEGIIIKTLYRVLRHKKKNYTKGLIQTCNSKPNNPLSLCLFCCVGTLPNVTRNAVVNASELVSYDLIKQQILSRQLMSDNMPCHFVSAFGAGFCTTVVASPVDVVKTRYMNSTPDQYTGAMNCAIKMFREGGFFAFYKG